MQRQMDFERSQKRQNDGKVDFPYSGSVRNSSAFASIKTNTELSFLEDFLRIPQNAIRKLNFVLVFIDEMQMDSERSQS